MKQHKKPCGDCPFRRGKAAPGWLGLAMPEDFIASILLTEKPLPCHKKIDYNEPDWLVDFEANPEGRRCAGSLIMTANMCKVPRDSTIPKLSVDYENVFVSPKEFINYHRAGKIFSWQDRPGDLRFLQTYLGLTDA